LVHTFLISSPSKKQVHYPYKTIPYWYSKDPTN